MLIEIKRESSPLNGLWLFQEGYSLNNELFSSEMRKKTLAQTKLTLNGLDDFWTHVSTSNPEFSWKELVDFSMRILNSEATRLLCHTMHVLEIPKVELKNVETLELPIHRIPVARRLTISCSIIDGVGANVMQNKFKLHGIESRDRAEGTWFHWIKLAIEVLANANTEIVCPELFHPELRKKFTF